MHALAVEAVTFDVGSTLLADANGEERRQASRALKHWLKEHGLRDKEERRHVLAVAARSWSDSDFEAATVAEKAAESIVASLPLPVVESESQRLQALLTDIYQDGPYYAADGVHAVLRSLQRRGIALGIVSNRGARPGRLMTLQLEAHGLVEFFDRKAVIWSDEVGASKPDPRPYLACLRALRVAPERAAHVGDVKAKDVAGARELGMTTIRYTGIRDDPGEGPEADIVISSFEQLEEALGLPAPARARSRLRLRSGLPFVLGPATHEAVEDGGETFAQTGYVVSPWASRLALLLAGIATCALTAGLLEAVTDRDWRLSGLEWTLNFVMAAVLVCLVPLALALGRATHSWIFGRRSAPRTSDMS